MRYGLSGGLVYLQIQNVSFLLIAQVQQLLLKQTLLLSKTKGFGLSL
jgi:hypothetical protein